MAGAEPSDVGPPLLYPLDADPPWRVALLVGAQHILAMFVPVISVPLILGQALGLPPEQSAYLVNRVS